MVLLTRLSLLISALFLSVSAHAAEWKVEVNDNGETYITMVGKTVRSDLVSFEHTLEAARNEEDKTDCTVTLKGEERCVKLPFSNVIVLTGPGGDARTGFNIAVKVRLEGLKTEASRDCISACSQIWLGGNERTIHPNGRVGFHFSYIPRGKNTFENILAETGWQGIQNTLHANAANSIASDLVFGIAKPFLYVAYMSRATIETLFWVDNDNLHIIGEIPVKVHFEGDTE